MILKIIDFKIDLYIPIYCIFFLLLFLWNFSFQIKENDKGHNDNK